MEGVPSRWVKIIWLITALAIAALLVFSIGDVVRLVIISALLAYILDPIAVFLESRGLSRTVATVIIFLVIISAVAISVLFFLPLVIKEVDAIQSGLNTSQTVTLISNVEYLLVKKFSFFGFQKPDLLATLHNAMADFGKWIFGHLVDVASFVINIVIMPFIIFFLLKDGRQIKKQFITIVPNRYFEISLHLLNKLDLQVGNYLRGQLLDAIIIGILSIFTLWLLDVRYFFLIGIFAGLANLIPYLGPVAGAAPAILVTIVETGDTEKALPIAIAFLLIKVIDDTLVQPLVVAKSVHMHPLLVLLVIIIGGKFFGILGMLLAVPLTGFIKVVLQESISNLRKYGLA
ncbi:MAG: AI-2E family transporter [Dissulfurispiraceae bacterium]